MQPQDLRALGTLETPLPGLRATGGGRRPRAGDKVPRSNVGRCLLAEARHQGLCWKWRVLPGAVNSVPKIARA